MDMIVTCDECGDTYQPVLDAAVTADGGEYQSFTCPHCKHEYPVCTITARGIELRDEIQHLRQSMAARFNNGTAQGALPGLLNKAMKSFERECRKGQKP